MSGYMYVCVCVCIVLYFIVCIVLYCVFVGVVSVFLRVCVLGFEGMCGTTEALCE